MRSITVMAFALLFAAIAAVSPSGSTAAAATDSTSRQANCEAQKKACLAAGTQTGQFGTRYVPPDVVKKCYDGYRTYMGQ